MKELNNTRAIGTAFLAVTLSGCICQQVPVQKGAKQSLVAQSNADDSNLCESRVLKLVYPISIHEMREILGKEEPKNPFYDPKTAGPLELFEKAGLPMKDVEVIVFDGLERSIIYAPRKTHKLIQTLIKKEPYSDESI